MCIFPVKANIFFSWLHTVPIEVITMKPSLTQCNLDVTKRKDLALVFPHGVSHCSFSGHLLNSRSSCALWGSCSCAEFLHVLRDFSELSRLFCPSVVPGLVLHCALSTREDAFPLPLRSFSWIPIVLMVCVVHISWFP